MGFSIPATEHSIMTSHKTEKDAMVQLLENFGSGVCACVMDSYDYKAALENLLPVIADLKVKKGGFLVLRPDSGDPVQVVMMALKAAEKVFGSTVNKKGYKVISGAGVIQGDGINIHTIKSILNAAEESGFSAQNIAFGMGGGLLQRVHRDTMSFATKVNKIVYANGEERDVMKCPKTETGKISLPGELALVYNQDGVSSKVITLQLPVVYPAPQTQNAFTTVYDHGKTPDWETFDTVRQRAAFAWSKSPKNFDPISDELRDKIKATISAQMIRNIESVV